MVMMTSPYPVWLLTWLYSPNREGEAVGERRGRRRRRKREGGNKKREGEEGREREERNEKGKDINTVLTTERLLDIYMCTLMSYMYTSIIL